MRPKKNPQKKREDRPMPTDPRELATAMFRQADIKMFGGVKAPLPKGKKVRPLAAG